MKIIQSFTTNNPCYRNNRKTQPKGLILHSVGCSQSQAEVFVRQWNRYNAQVGVHGVLDADGNVYQCLPWDIEAWHCGGSGNRTHIGVEMVEPDFRITNKKEHVLKTYAVAVELYAYLCKLYNIDPKTGILSHKEAGRKGIASGHGDPEKLWNTYKTGLNMDKFRQDVANAMNGIKIEPAKPVEPIKPVELTKPVEPIKPIESEKNEDIKVGDKGRLKIGATYHNGRSIPSWVFNKDIYIIQIASNGNYIFSTKPNGPATGIIKPNAFTKE